MSEILVVLPFHPSISYKIAWILHKFNFQVVFSPVNKIQSSALKDSISDFNSWRIYSISVISASVICVSVVIYSISYLCQCGLSYIGQTKRALKFHIKEHESYVRKVEINKSSIANHSWKLNHNFDFVSAKIIQK
ncbi:hypothetical protein X975_09311, partial [Stegodyphus mimosarum]